MIKSLKVTNFTVFGEAEFQFGALNIIHGENGTGKTQLLKLAYSIWATLRPTTSAGAPERPTKAWLEPELARKLRGVFRPDTLGRLARRQKGTPRAVVNARFANHSLDTTFEFNGRASERVSVSELPAEWLEIQAVYVPGREALSLFPGFVSLYENNAIPLDETWRDLCLHLDTRLIRDKRDPQLQDLLAPLEEAIGGSLKLDQQRFYLSTPTGNMEIDLVGEGVRKLAMLAWLIATKQIKEGGALFWDEPEANLNPRLTKLLAPVLIDLARRGVQIFVATHSLFLLRELYVVQQGQERSGQIRPLEVRYFGLHQADVGVTVTQGDELDDTGDLVALDESLAQSDRFLELENSL